MTDLTLPPCPTPCDDDCELNPDGCHESHQPDHGTKRSHQPWACHDLRVTMAEYAAAMIEQYARGPLPERLRRAPVLVQPGARSRRGDGTVAVTESAGSVTGTQDGAA